MALRQDELHPQAVTPTQQIPLMGLPEISRYIPKSPEATKALVRYLFEESVLPLEDKQFEEIYVTTIGSMLSGILEVKAVGSAVDPTSDLYDYLDEETPRTLDLLQRVKEEGRFNDPAVLTSFNKLVMTFTYQALQTLGSE